VTLPEKVKTMDVLKTALEEKVAFIPGSAFYPDGAGGQNTLRLTFATASPEMIEEAIKRLGKAVEKELARQQQ
jgi:2-aminoadipate transaminase